MIKNIITDSDIILYWDLTDCVCDGEKYFIYLNDEYVMATTKTHFTLRNITKKCGVVDIYTDEKKKNTFYHMEYILKAESRRIDISKAPYNAVGDGKTVNTKAIQRAIDDCKGNEYIYIPKGEYLTGALTLHSDMELYIEDGGTLLGSESPEDYLPKIWSRFEGLEMECYQSLLNMGDIYNRDEIKCRNILIRGGGRICGGGRPLAVNVLNVEKERLKAYMKSLGDELSTYENADTIPGRLRPKLINISCSQNVVIDNIKIANGSCWNVHMLYSDNIVTCNCRFDSRDVWNGDGWDPDSSTNCTLFNCDFNTGDDCVAIKSGKNPEGNVIAKPCKNIKVFDCRCEYGHGVTIGSEMSGGVSDVYIWDCDIRRTMYGLEIKGTKKRGGYVKDIYVRQSALPRIQIHSVAYNDDGVAALKQPAFSDLFFEDLTITGEALLYGGTSSEPCAAVEIVGFDTDNKVKNVVLKDIVIDRGDSAVTQTVLLQSIEGINISNLSIR